MKQTITIVCLSLAAGFAQATLEGELTRADFRASVCNIERMTIDVALAEAFGEPLLNGRIRWEAGPNTSENCLASDTAIYLKVEDTFGDNHYVRLDPDVRQAGAGFGANVNLSPDWNELFCNAAWEDASCLGIDEAKALFAADPKFLSFEVVTRSTIIGARNTSSPRRSKPAIDIDSLLAKSIAARDRVTEVEEPDAPEEPAAQTRSPTYDYAKTPEEASRNVITLLASSLARYETPPDDCESSQQVTNWALAGRDVCELVFRSETRHTFTCTEDGRPDQILRTENAEVDFASDVDFVSDPRVSRDGWVALVMKFNRHLAESGSDGIKSDRWQIAVSAHLTGEMKALAANLQALKQHCGEST